MLNIVFAILTIAIKAEITVNKKHFQTIFESLDFQNRAR
jgi:hypothetical protein